MKKKQKKTNKKKNLKKSKKQILKNKRNKTLKLPIKITDIKERKNFKNESFVYKLVKFQLSLKSKFNFNLSFSLEKYIQAFFDKISESISSYKILKEDEHRRIKIERIENERKRKIEIEKQKKEEELLKVKLKEKALKDEQKELETSQAEEQPKATKKSCSCC